MLDGRTDDARPAGVRRSEVRPTEVRPTCIGDPQASILGVRFCRSSDGSTIAYAQHGEGPPLVSRSGGTIGLISWTPEGFIGQMFATMKPYAPPPPPGAQPPPLWGSEDHVRELIGDRVSDVEMTRRTLPVSHFETAEDFREFFKTRYGPTIAVYKANAEDPERCAALDRDLDALAERFGVSDGTMEWEYLLVTATRR
jgi:hypothetical protein